jgi:hypothetical protein
MRAAAIKSLCLFDAGEARGYLIFGNNGSRIKEAPIARGRICAYELPN